MRASLGALLPLYRKELRDYFDTLTAYVVSVVVLLISGYLFSGPLFLQNQSDLGSFIGVAPFLFLFLVPAVTMRLYAEEFKSGTVEVLSTLPVRDGEVLAAKYFAALTLLTFLLAGTLFYPATLLFLGDPDPGGLAGAYLGLWLTAAMLAAVGTWASTMTRNQIIAFVLAFLAGFILFLAGKLQMFLPVWAAPVADFVGLDSHLENLSRGVLDTRDLLYYTGMAGFFLYAAFLRVSARRVP